MACSTASRHCAAAVWEQGAGWVVSWLRHLDHALRSFRRTEDPLRKLAAKPSEYVRRQLKFTPFPGEPVGWNDRAARLGTLHVLD